MNTEHPKKIIIRVPNWLGDLVMATPVLHDLRKGFPTSEITAMCLDKVAPVLREDPHLDELLTFSKPTGWLRRKDHGDLIQDLRRGQYDLGVLLTNSFSSAWWFYRARIPRRLGYIAHWRRYLLTDPVHFSSHVKEQHLVKTYKQLLSPLGIEESQTNPKLYLTREEREQAKKRLSQVGILESGHILVGINPGAAYGSAKCWLPERFREVTLRLLEDPRIRVVFFGDGNGAPLVEEICRGLPSEVVNLAGKTNLRELMALIDQCHVFLTNDSGPMHMASALDVPLLALFGSTSDVATGPYNQGRVIHKHVECSPCFKRVCPIDFRCMKRIHAQEVYDSLKDMLKGYEQ